MSTQSTWSGRRIYVTPKNKQIGRLEARRQCTRTNNQSKRLTVSRQGAKSTHVPVRMIAEKINHARLQMCMRSHLWMLFCMLLVSIAPNFCGGVYTKIHLQHYEHVWKLILTLPPFCVNALNSGDSYLLFYMSPP